MNMDDDSSGKRALASRSEGWMTTYGMGILIFFLSFFFCLGPMGFHSFVFAFLWPALTCAFFILSRVFCALFGNDRFWPRPLCLCRLIAFSWPRGGWGSVEFI